MKVYKIIAFSFSIYATGCVSSTVIDKLESDIKELRSVVADQNVAIEDLRSDISKLNGQMEETQFKTLDKTNQLERVLEQFGSRVPPPIGVPEDLLANDEELISKVGSTSADIFVKGLKEIRRGLFVEARDTFSLFNEQNPPNSFTDNALFWVGISSRLLNEHDRSIISFGEIIRKYPAEDRVPAALFYLGETFASTNSFDEAIDSFSKLIDDHPNSKFVQRSRVRISELKRLKSKK